MNLSSGVEATVDVTTDLLLAQSVGENAFNEFIKDRLQSTKTSFYDPVKRRGLKTFSSMKVKKVVKVKEKSVTIAAERSIFGRLLVIAKDREGLSLKVVLSYSLSPIPWCFGLPDGGLVKTVKSKLLGNYINAFIKSFFLIIFLN